MDRSGRKLSSVLMVSWSTSKILTIKILVHKLGILLDDGFSVAMASRWTSIVMTSRLPRF